MSNPLDIAPREHTAPAVSVPAGAHVIIELINADADMTHGLVVEQDDLTVACPGVSPGVVQQHEGEQCEDLALVGHELGG